MKDVRNDNVLPHITNLPNVYALHHEVIDVMLMSCDNGCNHYALCQVMDLMVSHDVTS